MKKILFFLFLTAMAVGAMPKEVQAQLQNVMITGFVYAPNPGTYIANAQVKLTVSPLGGGASFSMTTTTNAEGTFLFLIPAQTTVYLVAIEANATGYNRGTFSEVLQASVFLFGTYVYVTPASVIA